MAFFGLLVRIDIVLVCGQTDERGPAQNLLSLRPDLIFAGTSLLAQNDQVAAAPLPPSEFNPDPGAAQRIEPQAPPELFPPVLPQLPEYGEEPLPRSLELPRKGVHEVVPRRKKLGYETYPLSEQGEGLLPGSRPEPNRWFIGFGRWKRYADPSTETPYQSELQLWHPYLQSKFKGDAPIRKRHWQEIAGSRGNFAYGRRVPRRKNSSDRIANGARKSWQPSAATRSSWSTPSPLTPIAPTRTPLR